MRRDRTIVQEWDLSCGPAALATLLTYQHGDPVSEREIATRLSGDGEFVVARAQELQNGLRRYGAII
jgi:predicted double-glycine peptidase